MGLVNKPFDVGPNTPPNTNPVDADQLNSNFDTLYTLVSGAPHSGTKGNLDDTNVAAHALTKLSMATAFANGNVEPALGNYRHHADATGVVANTTANGSFALGQHPIVLPNSNVLPFIVIPSEFVADARSTLWRLRAIIATNNTAPSVNVTVGIAAVTGYTGTVSQTSPTFGADLAGSTVTFTNPAASSALVQTTSSDFSIAAQNFFVFTLRQSGGSGTSASGYAMAAWLDYHQV